MLHVEECATLSPQARVFEENEAVAAKKKIDACDLLLAKLYQHHPEHAIAALKNIKPIVPELDPLVTQIQRWQPRGIAVPMQTALGRPTVQLITKVTAEHYNVAYSDVISERRTRTLTKPRHVAMYLAKSMTPKSLPEIGRQMGDRDHTTILHGVRKITNQLADDLGLARDVEAITARISEILSAQKAVA